ncbi:MAG: ATP-binding protein [Chloroflexota bacterium]
MRIATAADVERARNTARRLSRELGFGPIAAETVALATSEMATNLLRYAIGGDLRISPIDGPSQGVLLESEDDGPGIADLTVARRDGFSTGSGLGAGLGSIERLMDECEFASTPAGTTIVARKWMDPH